MNQRENFEAIVRGERPEFSPIFFEVYKACIMATNNSDQPWQGGQDPFGVNWVATNEGAIPDPNKFMFTEISDWKKHVHFPDVESLGFEQMAEMELADLNREEQIVNALSVCGLFERMAAFMGFENTLCALLEDPESCHEFFEAFADYKINCINKMIDLYKPDVVTYFDDMATARGLFMSPKTYREVIKPHHKKIIEAVTARGVIFSQHTCGKCEDIVGDFVEMGARIWNSAQAFNDLDGIMDKYKGQLIVEGGWDSQGPASYIGASDEDIITELTRCAKQYGSKGNYILFAILMNGKDSAMTDPRIPMVIEEWHKVNRLS